MTQATECFIVQHNLTNFLHMKICKEVFQLVIKDIKDTNECIQVGVVGGWIVFFEWFTSSNNFIFERLQLIDSWQYTAGPCADSSHHTPVLQSNKQYENVLVVSRCNLVVTNPLPFQIDTLKYQHHLELLQKSAQFCTYEGDGDFDVMIIAMDARQQLTTFSSS